MRFVCDSTVGKLARWLRMAGFDTAYVREENIPRVLALSKEENRVILTRNSQLTGLSLAANLVLLHDDDPVEQFRRLAIDLKLQLDESSFLTRCLECNEPLTEVDKNAVRSRLYDYVARTQERILICCRCDKLYWHATHAQAMIDRLCAIKSELDRMSDGGQT